ncbi:MAG: DUF4810 domain-containing protein [Verrucomicrobia bacterium]|nr:DUF4810 domain-containing protein [Verrucomicrobiota bacterium]
MTNRFRLAAVGLVVLLGCGCQGPRTLFYWGRYEPLLYRGYAHPEKASVDEDVRLLEEDLAKAAATQQQAHPGLHAQLGYLYYVQGKVESARREFAAEKTLFPESAVFMDRLIGKLGPPPAT